MPCLKRLDEQVAARTQRFLANSNAFQQCYASG
jgi:hypothetical protein